MKILIFNTLYYPNQIGGAEKSVQLIAEGLLLKGHEPIVVCTSNKNYNSHVNGVKVYYIKTNNIYWNYNAKKQNKFIKPIWHIIDSYNILVSRKVSAIFNTEDPDIVHTNNLAGFSDIVWRIAKRYNKKIIHTLRDYYQLCPKSSMFKDNQNCTIQCNSCKLYSIPRKNASKHIDVVVGVSKFILEKHINLGYFENAQQEVIFNSVVIPDKFEKIKNNKISFGYVGSLSENKGIEILLETFEKLNLHNTRLLIYGKSSYKNYEDKLRERYECDTISFQGFQPPEDIYQNIDILIVPSLFEEPFGRIVAEANSYDIPVLVSKRGGLPEIIRNGQNGYVFEPDIDGDFEDKLELILTDFKSGKFVFDSSKFSMDLICSQYIELYKKLS